MHLGHKLRASVLFDGDEFEPIELMGVECFTAAHLPLVVELRTQQHPSGLQLVVLGLGKLTPGHLSVERSAELAGQLTQAASLGFKVFAEVRVWPDQAVRGNPADGGSAPQFGVRLPSGRAIDHWLARQADHTPTHPARRRGYSMEPIRLIAG